MFVWNLRVGAYWQQLGTTQLYKQTYQLFIVVGGEVPDVDGPTLVSHNKSGLVRMQAHTVDGGVDLEQPLTLLRVTPLRNGKCKFVKPKKGREMFKAQSP